LWPVSSAELYARHLGSAAMTHGVVTYCPQTFQDNRSPYTKPLADGSAGKRKEVVAMVRAKFQLNSYTTTMHSGWKDGKSTPPVEVRTLNFTPVCYDTEENKQFWASTPTGSLQLGTVNQEVWKLFELNKSYYLDFTPAP